MNFSHLVVLLSLVLQFLCLDKEKTAGMAHIFGGFMKSQLKQWFLYGTLFGALGFVLSGSDPQLEGHIQFSSNERAPNAAQLDAARTPKQIEEAKTRAAAAGAASAPQAPAAGSTGAAPAPQAPAAGSTGAAPAPQAPAGSSPSAEATRQAEAARDAEAARQAAAGEVQIDDSTADNDNLETIVVRQRNAPTVVPTASSTTARNGRTAAQQRGTPQVTPAERTQARDFEKYTVTVKTTEDGKTKERQYQVHLTYESGKTTALFYTTPEGRNCPSCRENAHEVTFTGDARNFEAIKKKLADSVIADKLKRKTKSDTARMSSNEKKEGNETEEVSAGAKLLEKLVDKPCKHLEGKANLRCRTNRFISALKANKTSSKNKSSTKERTITDADAVEYFNKELRDYLKDMLTHNFEFPELPTSVWDRFEASNMLRTAELNKRDAVREKNEAKDMIRNLLRQIDRTYSDTRAEVSGLYKEALNYQGQDVLSNLRDMSIARSSNDIQGFQRNWGSFLENFGFMKALNTDLYGAMTDGLRFANRNGLIDGDPYRSILQDVNDARNSILKDFINNNNLLTQGSASVLDSPAAIVTNALRGQRGGSAPITSGAAPSAGIRRGGATGIRGQ